MSNKLGMMVSLVELPVFVQERLHRCHGTTCGASVRLLERAVTFMLCV